MDVKTISMPRADAREKLKALRANFHKDAEEEYKAAEVAYTALAQGTPLIDLAQVFDEPTLWRRIEKGWQPAIGFARADRKVCQYRRDAHSARLKFDYRGEQDRGSWSGRWRDTLCAEFYCPSIPIDLSPHRGESIVPTVPADVRPDKGQLREWHILWEVDVWKPVPPVDPILIKHVGGSLWAVLAEWDLTEVEQAILRGRVQ